LAQVYELLAFVVALFFPVALLAWLVIDKFFSAPDGEGHAVRVQAGGGRQDRMLADHSRREA